MISYMYTHTQVGTCTEVSSIESPIGEYDLSGC